MTKKLFIFLKFHEQISHPREKIVKLCLKLKQCELLRKLILKFRIASAN